MSNNEVKEYEIKYSKQFERHLQEHRLAGQKSVIIKIGKLIEELRKHPTKGTGSSEFLLWDMKGQWSRRITHQHRLVYEIYEDVVTVYLISAKGHYGDK